jgi:hypothetical protein
MDTSERRRDNGDAKMVKGAFSAGGACLPG